MHKFVIEDSKQFEKEEQELENLVEIGKHRLTNKHVTEEEILLKKTKISMIDNKIATPNAENIRFVMNLQKNEMLKEKFRTDYVDPNPKKEK